MSDFIINEKYKPVPEIENHRIGLEQMNGYDALHLAYLCVKDSNYDEEIKQKVIEYLSRIFLRTTI